MRRAGFEVRANWFELALLTTVLLLVPASIAGAVDANGPDDICGPTDDPCIVDQKYDVLAPGGILDFGLREVRIVSPGELRRTSSVLCGSFTATANTNAVAVNTNEGGGVAGSFTVQARRGCSGDPAMPCFTNSNCSGAGLGTCDAGPDGRITINGKIESRGADGGSVRLDAVGDVNVNDHITTNATAIGGEGGYIDLSSSQGSVFTTDRLTGNAGSADQYNSEPDSAGGLDVDAALDIVLGERMEFSGGSQACGVDLSAGRDLTIGADIACDAGNLAGSYGGYVRMYAEDNLAIVGTSSNETRISTTGGSQLYYYYQYPGGGGQQYMGASASIYVDEHTVMEAHTSFGGTNSCVDAYAGYITAFSYEGLFTFNGRIEAEGRSKCGRGARVRIENDYYAAGVIFGPDSQIDIPGKYGGYLAMYLDGPVELNGTINLRGRVQGGTGEYSYPGVGGAMFVGYTGNPDPLVISGTILNGSDNGMYGTPVLQSCRFRLEDGANINLTHGEKWNSGFFPEGIDISAYESMYFAPGSKITTAKNKAGQQGPIELHYRSIDKPPVILGDLDRAPDLFANPGWPGCPVCGNLEIDKSESCDDGNLTSGDGCRDDCQDEGCIAETPGYPGVALCDDGDACTVDTCDPVVHTCSHVASCEEGVACTADSCVLGACEHVPDDLACDDANDCTVDVCNLTNGCSYADLDGTACDDGDFCTVTDICATGDCIATDSRLGEKTNIKVKVKDGPANDRGKIKIRLPSAHFTANPTVTGAEIELRDADDATVLNGVLPAAGWEDQGGAGLKFRFRDRDGLYPSANGLTSVSIKLQLSKGIAKVSAKSSDVELTGAIGQDKMSVSFLFGTDPSVDDCITGIRVPCKIKATSTSCKE